MADTTGLPSMPSTVDLAGGEEGLQGDPLEIMRNIARQTIDSVNKNALPNENEKVEFKKYVLKKLQDNITKFDKLDAQVAETKAQEKAALGDGEEEKSEEEDPFADIFGEEDGEQDETVQEKMKIAQGFISDVKLTKEKFLKQVRMKREKQQAETDEKNMEEILGKLDEV